MQCAGNHGHAEPVALSDGRGAERPMRAGVADYQVAQRIGGRLGESFRYTGRKGDAKGVT